MAPVLQSPRWDSHDGCPALRHAARHATHGDARVMFTPDRTLDALLALTTGSGRDRNVAIEDALRATCQMVEAEAASFLWYDGRRATRTTVLENGGKVVEEHPNPGEGLF